MIETWAGPLQACSWQGQCALAMEAEVDAALAELQSARADSKADRLDSIHDAMWRKESRRQSSQLGIMHT